MATKRINKYLHEIWLQGYYFGYGWSDEICNDTMKDAREMLKTYRENVKNTSFRIITRRVINEDWVKLQESAQ